MKAILVRFGIILVLFAGALFYFSTRQPKVIEPPPVEIKTSTSTAKTPDPNLTEELKSKMNNLLASNQSSNNTLEIPKPPIEKVKPKPDIPKPPPPVTERAKGRQKRASLPLGIVLHDKSPVYENPTNKKVRYTMMTGDFVRVFPDTASENGFIKVQPGVDLYLAQTSKQFEAAGNRFPDRAGWIRSSDIQIFNPTQAIEFTQQTTPVTLGADPSFSTLSFYERAMKNPDPVVHRVMGPRLISILSIAEGYIDAWEALIRDHDSKIRSVTLAYLRKQGVGNSRGLIEDLIKRLAELTQKRAQGEGEAEVLQILAILKESQHPRVPVALQSFHNSWPQTQNKAILTALNDIVPPQKITPKKKKKK